MFDINNLDLPDCPFCGGKAIIVRHPGYNWDGVLGKGYNIGGMHGTWYVGCPLPFFETEVPHCEIKPSASWYGKLEDAVKAWCTRISAGEKICTKNDTCFNRVAKAGQSSLCILPGIECIIKSEPDQENTSDPK